MRGNERKCNGKIAFCCAKDTTGLLLRAIEGEGGEGGALSRRRVKMIVTMPRATVLRTRGCDHDAGNNREREAAIVRRDRVDLGEECIIFAEECLAFSLPLV